ncbi:MAG: hypothetical protein KGL74_14460 [Elusimicrobia bacterium]|nr:hypothetical protein [Elusimicrobiota bacterium]MDE2512324.1 hypothetical protein [Elusimicrobiota bacterium]
MNAVGRLWNRDVVRARAVDEQRRLAGRIARAMAGIVSIGAETPVPLRPLLLDLDEYEALRRSARTLAKIIVDACERKSGGDAARLAALTRHPQDHLRIMSPTTSRLSASNVRPDAILSGGVPWFIECNFHSAVGGVVPTGLLNGIYAGSAAARRLQASGFGFVFHDSMEARRRQLLEVVGGLRLRRAPRIALIGWEKGQSSIREIVVEVEHLRERGMQAYYVRPEDVRLKNGGLSAGGRSFDVAVRIFLTPKWLEAGIDLEPYARAARAGATIIVTDDRCSLYTNKIVLAWLHQEPGLLEPHAREFVAAHVPWTCLVRDGKASFRGREIDTVPFLLKHRRQLLLKPLAGYGGKGIVFGNGVDQASWSELVRRGAAESNFIAQKYVPSDLVPMPFFIPDPCRVIVRRVPVVFGPHHFGSHAGGMLARHAASPGSGSINWGRAFSNTVFGTTSGLVEGSATAGTLLSRFES